MNHLARRGLAAVATGMLALGLSACGAISDAANDAKEDVAEGTTLNCKDLSDTVWEHSPDEDLTLFQTPEDQYGKIADWMADNGKDFSDETVGEAVTTYGELGRQYYKYYNEADAKALNEEDIKRFEAADKTIGDNCADLGFGMEPTE
jgi:hypothetical protein